MILVEVDTEEGDKRVISVAREVWKSVKYTWNDVEGCVEEETVGSFEQFPLWRSSMSCQTGTACPRVD